MRLRYANGGDGWTWISGKRAAAASSARLPHDSKSCFASSARSCAALCRSWAAYATCWSWQPPQGPKCGHCGSARSRSTDKAAGCSVWPIGSALRVPFAVVVGHVEEAEARQRVGFQQALLQELLLDLLDLDGLHAATIGGERAGSLLAQRDQLGFGGCGQQRGDQLLFEDAQDAVEVFEVQGARRQVQGSRFEVRGGCKVGGERAEAGGGFGGGGGGRRGQGGGGGIQQGGVAHPGAGAAAGLDRK